MPMRDGVHQLHRFMVQHGLTSGNVETKGCTNCDAFKAIVAQRTLLDNFASIFIRLHDAGRMNELRELKRLVGAAKSRPFRRVILAYAGKASGGEQRTVIVE
jgi:hypothetical protein